MLKKLKEPDRIKKLKGKGSLRLPYFLGHMIRTRLDLSYKECDPQVGRGRPFKSAPLSVSYRGNQVSVYPAILEYLEKCNIVIPQNGDPENELNKYHDHALAAKDTTTFQWYNRKIVKGALPNNFRDQVALDDFPKDVGQDREWILDIIVRVTNPEDSGMQAGFHQELRWDGKSSPPQKWIGDPSPKQVF